MATYTWKIDDPSLVKKIKADSKSLNIFYSDVFSMFGMRWQLQLEANCKCEDEKDKQQSLLFLYLKSMSPKIKSVRIDWKRCLLPGDIEYRKDNSLTHERLYGLSWSEDYGILAREVIEKYDKYAIKIDVELLAVYDQNDDDITSQFLKNDDTTLDKISLVPNPHNVPMASYSWKIDEPSLVKRIKKVSTFDNVFYSSIFSMFGLLWQLKLRSNAKCKDEKDKVQTLIYLNLKDLPPNISSVRVDFTYSLSPGDMLLNHERGDDTSDFLFTHHQKYAFGWPEYKGILARESIETYDEYTIGVDCQLLAVYDNNDCNITQQFLRNDHIKIQKSLDDKTMHTLLAEVRKLSKRVEQIEKNEKKENNLDIVMNEIKSLKEAVSKLTAEKNQNPKTTELRAWLEDKVGCPQYFDLFAENGIEDLSTAKLLTMETLKAIGVEKIGHCMKILHQVAALNQNKNDEEGKLLNDTQEN